MSTIVKKKAVTRKKGYLYFVDGQGNVRSAKMARGGKKKRRTGKKKRK